MTPEQLAASLIADVDRIYPWAKHQPMMLEDDVLAALARAMGPDDLVTEAGKVLEGVTLRWDRDGRKLHMDQTMAFSKSYDWNGWDCFRQEGYGGGANYIIWPDSIGSEKWNLYGTADGLFITDLDGEIAAKAAAQKDYETHLGGPTSGPWRIGNLESYEGDTGVAFRRVYFPTTAEGEIQEAHVRGHNCDANARFIAWCREGVPALLARLAAQEAQIAEKERTYDDLYADALADAKSDAQDFDSDLWKMVRAYLDELHFDWRDFMEDGVTADEAVSHIRECMKEETRRAEAAETALAAERAKVAKLVEAGNGLNSLVEGIQGAMQHGTWRDEKGNRLKDTPEWVAFYNARAAITEAGHEST